MPVPVVPVFISSTWLDLIPEHEAAERAVQTLRQTKYVGMKHFGSRDETTRAASLEEVDKSEVYVGILAGRYGSGITEAEYRRATERNLPRFIYFKRDARIAPDQRETDPEKAARLVALKQELRAAHTVAEFDTPEELRAAITADLHRWLFDNYLPTKLHGALRGETPPAEAQALLDAVKDIHALNSDLLKRLQVAGFNFNVSTSGGDFVGRDKITNIHAAPDPSIYALHQLPPPPRDFTGREDELAELMSKLGQGVTISGLQGLGGIGKTALALKLAEGLKARYPDAQFYLDLKGASPQPLSPAAAASLCNAYPNAGELLTLRRHPREIIVWVEAALAAARRLKDRAGERAHLGNLSYLYSALGENHRAIEFGEQTLLIAREIGDRRGEGSATGNLGAAYAALGETRRAVEFYEQCLAIAREIGDRRSEGNALGNLGNAYDDLGETRRAVEFYEQQLSITREIGDRWGEGNALFNTGLALDKLGDRAEALTNAEAALEIYEQIESPHVAKVRAKIAEWRGEG